MSERPGPPPEELDLQPEPHMPSPEPEAIEPRPLTPAEQIELAATQGEREVDYRVGVLRAGFTGALNAIEDPGLRKDYYNHIAEELWPYRQHRAVEALLHDYGFDPFEEAPSTLDASWPKEPESESEPVVSTPDEEPEPEPTETKGALSRSVTKAAGSVKKMWQKVTRGYTDQDLAEVEVDTTSPADAIDQLTRQRAIIYKFNSGHAFRQVDTETVERVDAQIKEAYDAYIKAELEGGTSHADILKQLDSWRLQEAETVAEMKTHGQKALELWRKHPKLRFVIGVGLVGGVAAGVATGAGAVAIGSAAARAGISGLSGYFGARSAQEAGEQMWRHRKNGELGKMKEQDVLGDDGKAIGFYNILEQQAARMNAEARGGRSEKHQQQDEAALEILAEAERFYIKEWLETEPDDHAAVYKDLIDGRLEATDEQLAKDRKSQRRRTVIAGTVGAVLAIAGGARTVEVAEKVSHLNLGNFTENIKDKLQAIQENMQATPDLQPPGGSPDNAPDSPNIENQDTPPEKPDAPEFQTRNVTVKSGDSVWKIAEQQLERQDPDFKNATGFDRVQKIDRAKDLIIKENNLSNPDLIHPGQKIKVTASVLRSASKY